MKITFSQKYFDTFGHCYKTPFDGTGKTKEELHENMMNILKFQITLIMLGV